MDIKESNSITNADENIAVMDESRTRTKSRLGKLFDLIGRICIERQRLPEGKTVGITRLGLERLAFVALFGGLSFIVITLLFRNMTLLGVISASAVIGIGFFAGSFFFTVRKYLCMFLWLLGPVFSLIVTEVLIGNINFDPLIIKLTFTQAILNFVWYYILAVLLYLATGRLNLSSGIAAVLGFIWGNLNFFIFRFRGRILFPADITSIKTAVSVQSDYDWTLTVLQWGFVAFLVIYLALLFITASRSSSANIRSGFTNIRSVRKRPRLRITLPIFTACLVYIIMFFGTSFVKSIGIQPSFWYTQQNGVLLNFMVNLNYSYVGKPDGYSTDAIRTMADASGPVNAVDQKKPNIIVVMNEAFSDINVLGDFEVSGDCMPFFNNLKENTIKGYTYSSVYGGNTANSEYEFLTGNTMAFLPAGTVPYQLYVSKEDYSLTGQLNGLGYKSIAMHPYESECWNRVAVYADYGFSEAHFKDDYEKRGYVRYYIGDKINYEKLISIYEDNKAENSDTPMFFFNVTMQNHGGYKQDWVNLDRSVYLTGENEELYPTVDQYLSLIKKSDEALEMLINYFSEVKEPTVILMFGDHQPVLDPAFYESLFGKPVSEFTTSEREQLNKVPFMLWTNYDIKEQDGIITSNNYLASLLIETAGLPQTEYQDFLAELSHEIPVINSIGYLESDGEFTDDIGDLSITAQELIHKYKMAQYNGIFDKRNMVDSFFFLPDQ